MAGSVWYAETETALIALMKSTVTIGGVAVPVYVANPQAEYAIQSFPAMSMSKVSENFARDRYSYVPVVVSKNEAGKTCSVEQPAKPFNLIYQIDFWTELLSDLNEMSRKWQSKVGHQYALEVKDTLNVTRYCNMKLIETPRNLTEGDMDKTIYHLSSAYEIWVELDETPPVTKPMVVSRVFRVKQIKS